MSKFGIDVSGWQGKINWDLVKDQINFAIIRLGYIGNNEHVLDKYFERNYSECKRLGIPVGVYVYNYAASVARAESGANWVVKKLAGKQLDLPVYIDMEDVSIAKKGKHVLTNICIAFNTIIEKAGFWAGVYANANWYNNYLIKDTIKTKYTTWIAHYTDKKDKYKGEYDVWQNSSSGRINGISGNVDTNYMYRDLIKEINKSKKNVSNVDKNVNNFTIYKIQRGDTLSKIAKKYNTTYQYLAEINKIKDPNKIVAGAIIKVPAK